MALVIAWYFNGGAEAIFAAVLINVKWRSFYFSAKALHAGAAQVQSYFAALPGLACLC